LKESNEKHGITVYCDVSCPNTILKKRMGSEAISRSRFGFITQKAEAMMHAFSKTIWFTPPLITVLAELG
jgi:hypothetical protein